MRCLSSGSSPACASMPPSRPAIASAVARFVAGEHHHPQPLSGERPQARRGIRTRFVAHGNRSAALPPTTSTETVFPSPCRVCDPSQFIPRPAARAPGRLGRAQEKLDAVLRKRQRPLPRWPWRLRREGAPIHRLRHAQDGTAADGWIPVRAQRRSRAPRFRLCRRRDVGQLRPAFGGAFRSCRSDGRDPCRDFRGRRRLIRKTAACTCRKTRGDRGSRGDAGAQGQRSGETASPL